MFSCRKPLEFAFAQDPRFRGRVTFFLSAGCFAIGLMVPVGCAENFYRGESPPPRRRPPFPGGDGFFRKLFSDQRPSRRNPPPSIVVGLRSWIFSRKLRFSCSPDALQHSRRPRLPLPATSLRGRGCHHLGDHMLLAVIIHLTLPEWRHSLWTRRDIRTHCALFFRAAPSLLRFRLSPPRRRG